MSRWIMLRSIHEHEVFIDSMHKDVPFPYYGRGTDREGIGRYRRQMLRQVEAGSLLPLTTESTPLLKMLLSSREADMKHQMRRRGSLLQESPNHALRGDGGFRPLLSRGSNTWQYMTPSCWARKHPSATLICWFRKCAACPEPESETSQKGC